MRNDDFDGFARSSLPALGRYAFVLTGDRDDAQDLVQDTLVRVARAWSRVEASGNPVAYAKTAMVRLHVSALRRAQRWRRALPVMATAHRDAPDPAFERVDERDRLRDALHGLSAPQRAVIALTYFDDHSDEAIAGILRRRPGAVRALRHRALGRLRAALDGESLGLEVDHDGR